MATENLEIKITADVQDALNKVKAVKSNLQDINESTGVNKMTSDFRDGANAASQLADKLSSIRSKGIGSIIADFANMTANIKAAKTANAKMAAEMIYYKECVKNAERELQRMNDILKEYKARNKDFIGDMSDEEVGAGIKSLEKDISRYTKTLADDQRKLSSLNEAAAKSSKGLWASMSKGAKAAAVAIGAVIAAVTAMTAAFRTALSVSQSIRTDFFDARKIGLSTASYQEWAYVLSQVGIEADALSDFIKSLSAAQNDLRDGSEAMTQAFKDLGFNINEVVNMGQEELFTETVKRLQQLENQVQKTSIAYRIFGEDDAAKIANLMSLNNQEMERMIRNFYLLGGAASDSAIEKSLALQGAVSSMRIAWQGLANTIAEAVMPILTTVVKWVTIAIAAVNMFLRAVFGLEIVASSSKGSMNKATAGIGGYTSAVEGATAAAKELKRTTMGFDELNIVSDPNKDAGGGGGADMPDIGGGGASFEMPDLSGLTEDLGLDKMAAWFEENAESIRKWTGVVAAATAGWLALKTAIFLLTGQKITFFGTLAKGISKVIGLLGKIPGLGTAITAIGTAFKGIGTAVSGVVTTISSSAALIVAAITAIASAIYFVIKNWDEVSQAAKNFFNQNIAPKLQSIGDNFRKLGDAIWNAIPPSVQNLLSKLGEGITKVYNAIANWLKSVDIIKALGTVFEWLGGIVTGVLGGVIGGAISGFLQLIDGVVETVTGAVNTISGLFELLGEIISGVFTGDFSGVADAWQKTCDGVVEAGQGMYDGTIGVVEEFINGVIDWFTEMWDILVGHSIVPDTVEAIIDWFNELPKKVLKFIIQFVNKIIEQFTRMAAKVVGKAKDMMGDLKKVWEKIKSTATQVWKSIEDFLKKTWSTIKSTATNAWNNIKSFLNTTWNNIKSTATKIFDAVKKFFSDTWNSIKTTATTIWNAIKTFLTTTWNNVKTTATTIFNALKQFLTDTWNNIKNTATTIWTAIKTFLDTTWNNIKTTATTIWNAIKQFFADTWNSIKDTATQLWNAIKTMLTDTWNIIKDTANKLCENLKEFFQKCWEFIKNTWSVVKGYFQDIWDNIKSTANTLVENLKSFFTNAWNTIKGVWDVVKGYFSSIWDSIRNTASSMLESVKSFFSSAWSNIKNVWSGVASWFGSVWSGIQSAFSGVANWFGNIFSSAVTAIKNAWNGIASWFSGVWNSVKNVFTSAGTALSSGIVGALKSSFNSFMSGAVGLINGFIRGINSAIGLINKIPGVSIGYLGTLSVPQLAKGGIVTDSILANIGERGKEAVLPLENNTGWMDVLADRIAARNSGSTRVVLQVDGRELGWATIENINAITKQTGGIQLLV